MIVEEIERFNQELDKKGQEFNDVDCPHYEYQQNLYDADEVCHLDIGTGNCHKCQHNKALLNALKLAKQ